MEWVFVHGSGGDGRVWRDQVAGLANARAVTLPGHPDGARCETVEAASDWLHAELPAPGDEGRVLVGHSLGGAIVLQYALDHGTSLAGIVLIGSGARLRVHPATLATLERCIEEPDDFPKVFEDWYRKLPEDFRRELHDLSMALGPACFLDDLRACHRFDVMDRLGEIDLPALALVGSDDAMTPPKYSAYLAEHLPRGELCVIEGGTHFVFAEQPEAVNRALGAFVASLGGGRSK